MIVYLDTSAAFKLLIDEPDTPALTQFLEELAPADVLVSSMLLFTEMHCAAQRRAVWDAEAVNAVLSTVSLVDLTRTDLSRAGTSGWGLRQTDSLHLATALRVEADTIVAYDRELSTVSTAAGMTVVQPRDPA